MIWKVVLQNFTLTGEVEGKKSKQKHRVTYLTNFYKEKNETQNGGTVSGQTVLRDPKAESSGES